MWESVLCFEKLNFVVKCIQLLMIISLPRKSVFYSNNCLVVNIIFLFSSLTCQFCIYFYVCTVLSEKVSCVEISFLRSGNRVGGSSELVLCVRWHQVLCHRLAVFHSGTSWVSSNSQKFQTCTHACTNSLL